MGDRDRVIWNSKQKRFVNERSCCSYRVHIRRVIKKEEAPHYIIDGNSNFERNDDCLLNTCFGNTTLRRKIKVEAVTIADDKSNNLEGFFKITPASESVKYTPREHCEMQQVMRRPFEKHSQRSIV